jgi:acetate kinase
MALEPIMHILVLNAGSSSEKAALYALDEETLPSDAPEPVWEAHVEWSERSSARATVTTASGVSVTHEYPAGSRSDLVADLLPLLWSGPTQIVMGKAEIDVVGHRVVHGGPDYSASIFVTPKVTEDIRRLAAFAPAHNPENLEGIEAVTRVMGDIAQVAVFDTAFHAHLPLAAAAYAGPYAWYERGIRRYGFHGISHQYCAERAAKLLGRDLTSLRLITAHLGNGCSLAAIAGGRSIDTTMGFTPLDGLMMGSRSGSVDPSILTYLQRADGATADQLETTLNHESGLLGISGVSSDMREVLGARAKGNARAALAFDMYVHSLRRLLGAMLAVLGGADALVFAGGVGEHAAEVRAGACATLGFLGLALDPALNAASPADTLISTPTSTPRVLIVHTQEDWIIARDCWHLLREHDEAGTAHA